MAKIELLIWALAVIILMFVLAPLARGEDNQGSRCELSECNIDEKPLVINGGAQLEFKESEEAPFAVLSGDNDYMEFNYPPADLEWTCLDDLVSKVRCFKNKFYFKQKEEK